MFYKKFCSDKPLIYKYNTSLLMMFENHCDQIELMEYLILSEVNFVCEIIEKQRKLTYLSMNKILAIKHSDVEILLQNT